MHLLHRIANVLYIKKNRSNNDGMDWKQNIKTHKSITLIWYTFHVFGYFVELIQRQYWDGRDQQGLLYWYFFFSRALRFCVLGFRSGFRLIVLKNKIVLSNYKRELLESFRFESHFKYSLYTFSSSKSNDLTEVVFVLWLAGILLGSSSIIFRYWIVAPRI